MRHVGSPKAREWHTIESVSAKETVCPACGDLSSRVALPHNGKEDYHTCLECGTTFLLSRRPIKGQPDTTLVVWREFAYDDE